MPEAPPEIPDDATEKFAVVTWATADVTHADGTTDEETDQ